MRIHKLELLNLIKESVSDEYNFNVVYDYATYRDWQDHQRWVRSNGEIGRRLKLVNQTFGIGDTFPKDLNASYAVFESCTFYGPMFTPASKMKDTEFINCRFKNADFSSARDSLKDPEHFEGIKFVDCNFDRVSLESLREALSPHSLIEDGSVISVSVDRKYADRYNGVGEENDDYEDSLWVSKDRGLDGYEDWKPSTEGPYPSHNPEPRRGKNYGELARKQLSYMGPPFSFSPWADPMPKTKK